MIKINRLIRSITMILALALLAGGCVIQTESEEPQKPFEPDYIQGVSLLGDKKEASIGGDLRLGARMPKTLNPLLNTDQSLDFILRLMFEPLFELDEQMRAIPCLADNVQFIDNGKTALITLKSNILWHDGQAFTADDVVYSLRAIELASDDTLYKKNISYIQSYSKVSESIVKVVFKQASSAALYYLCFPVIPKHYYSDINIPTDTALNALSFNPVGSGPYMFSEYSKEQLTLKYYPNYRPERPYIETISVTFSPYKESDLYRFDQALLDAVSTDITDWQNYSRVMTSAFFEYPSQYFDFIGFNFNSALFQEQGLRQAIAHAIPAQDIIRDIYHGHAVAAQTPVNPASWLFADTVKQYEYDMSKAGQLLTDAGYQNKTEAGLLYKEAAILPLTFSILVNKENTERMKVAELVSQKLTELGIGVTIDALAFEQYMEKLKAKDFDIYIGGWQLSTLPDLSFAFHSSQIEAENGTNYGSYNSVELDSLLRNATDAKTDTELQLAFLQIQKHLIEKLPYVGIVFRTSVVLTNSDVAGEIKPVLNNPYNNIEKWFIAE